MLTLTTGAAQRNSVAIAAAPLALFLKSFRLRCWARHYLAVAGEISWHEAVDVLQSAAEAQGLVDVVGQDFIQAEMAEFFKERLQ
jgi:hypothetical protein